MSGGGQCARTGGSSHAYFCPGQASQRLDTGTAAHLRLGRALDHRPRGQGRQSGSGSGVSLHLPATGQPGTWPKGRRLGRGWPGSWEACGAAVLLGGGAEGAEGAGGSWEAWRVGGTARRALFSAEAAGGEPEG